MKTSKINSKGQGTTEYIVILAIVVGFGLILIKTQLGQQLSAAIGKIGTSLNTATANN